MKIAPSASRRHALTYRCLRSSCRTSSAERRARKRARAGGVAVGPTLASILSGERILSTAPSLMSAATAERPAPLAPLSARAAAARAARPLQNPRSSTHHRTSYPAYTVHSLRVRIGAPEGAASAAWRAADAVRRVSGCAGGARAARRGARGICVHLTAALLFVPLGVGLCVRVAVEARRQTTAGAEGGARTTRDTHTTPEALRRPRGRSRLCLRFWGVVCFVAESRVRGVLRRPWRRPSLGRPFPQGREG